MRKTTELTNSFTEKCDEYLIDGVKEAGFFTYFHSVNGKVLIDDKGYIKFRVPGATRGSIKLNGNIIEKVSFYEDVCFSWIGCYKEEVVNVAEEYIGKEFDLPVEW